VHTREELFHGPFVDRAPDLLLELRLDRGYSYNLVPSTASQEAGYCGRLSSGQYLGKKGRSLPGSHRPRGLLIAAGPGVSARGQIEASIADSSALVLARLGVALPAGARGKLPEGVLRAAAEPRVLPEVSTQKGKSSNVAALEARLRALGYVD
jgi:hypothetical protein